jgi:hypothetical protein
MNRAGKGKIALKTANVTTTLQKQTEEPISLYGKVNMMMG